MTDEDPGGNQRREPRWDPGTLAAVTLFSVAFFAATIAAGARLDYVFHLQIWDVVLRGGDPWFSTPEWGVLNSYGPLFNVLAPLTRIHPLAPKLAYALAYVLFVAWMLAGVRPRDRLFWMAVWILNPLPWLEVAYGGHFDILVGLACVGAVHARRRGRDAASGIFVAAGVLLKFLPIVILPFLALDGVRVRYRLLGTGVLLTVAGLAASVLVWGTRTFAPFAVTTARGPVLLSVFRFLQGQWSPLAHLVDLSRMNTVATLCLVAVGLLLFVAWWLRSIGPTTGALLAVLTTLLFFKVGLLQYQIILFLLASYWYCERAAVAGDRLLDVAFAAYFGSLALFDVFLCAVGPVAYFNGRFAWMEEWVGLPAFLLGLLLFTAVWRSSDGEASKVGVRR